MRILHELLNTIMEERGETRGVKVKYNTAADKKKMVFFIVIIVEV